MNQIKPKILVADDDLMNGKVLSFFCSLLGFEVMQVSNGQEALTICKRDLFDVILMDINMPQMDGVEAKIKINEWYKNHNHVCKFVGMSSAYQMNDAYIFNARFDVFMQKPVNTSELKRHLMMFLPS